MEKQKPFYQMVRGWCVWALHYLPTLLQTKTQTREHTHTHTHIQPRFIASDHTPHELTSLAGKREREREKVSHWKKLNSSKKPKRSKTKQKAGAIVDQRKTYSQKRIKALATTTQNYSSADCQAASSFSGYYFESWGSHFVVLFFPPQFSTNSHYLKQKSKRETK